MRRLRRRAVLIVTVILALLAGGSVWLNERQAYDYDIASCYSDNMFALKVGLNDYVAEHAGQMPATFDELRAYMTEKKGGPYDICARAGAPFAWMPEGVMTDDGRSVVVMCPPGSHGWLRRYAFGLVRDNDGAFDFVRVRNDRARPFRP